MNLDLSFIPDKLQCLNTLLSKAPLITIQNKYLSLPCTEDSIQSILPFCEKSAFGKGQETVYDEQIRKAMEITKNKVKLPEDFMADILNIVNYMCAEHLCDPKREKDIKEIVERYWALYEEYEKKESEHDKALEKSLSNHADEEEENDKTKQRFKWTSKGREMKSELTSLDEKENIMKKEYENTKKIRVEFYKLLVYKTGGFFEKHLDTIRSETHFGTLVVLLPCECQGGELVLHGKEKISFQNTLTETRAILFPTQMAHEVLPVISGVKVCLTFNLHCSVPIGFSQSICNEGLLQKIKDMLDKCDFKKPFVTKLSNKYSIITKHRLIGKDFLLNCALQSLGYETQIVCLKLDSEMCYGESIWSAINEGDFTVGVFDIETDEMFDEIEIKKKKREEKKKEDKKDEEEEEEEDDNDDNDEGYGNVKKYEICSSEYQYDTQMLENMGDWVKMRCENTGNEGAAFLCVYSDCFMIISKKNL